MADEKDFECRKCGRKARAANAPDCCGGKMAAIPMDACTGAFSDEHSRPMEDEEPCNDSRGG